MTKEKPGWMHGKLEDKPEAGMEHNKIGYEEQIKQAGKVVDQTHGRFGPLSAQKEIKYSR